MKKALCIAIAVLILVGIAACAKQEGGAADALPLTDLLAKVNDGVELPDLAEVSVTSENFSSYLFIDYIEGAEALASEAMINAIPHSVVALRVPEGTDAAAIAAEIEQNANPAKWICVVADEVIVKRSGSTILLIMSFSDAAQAIAANFDALASS